MSLRPCCFAIVFVLLGAAGCANTLVRRSGLPGEFTVARHQLMIHSDFPLPEHHRLMEDLNAQRVDLAKRLALPASDEPIHVYVFESPERFNEYMRVHHPEFPKRRAFFIETDTRLSVYTQWGDRVGDDLRHEATHGHLHSVARNLPLWLDEGLAKYGENPPYRGGVNRELMQHIVPRLQQNIWQPDLARLERIAPDRDLSLAEYAESWAWVHFLMDTQPEHLETLRAYLADLRRGGPVEPLSARLRRLMPNPEYALIEHVRSLPGQ
jgi:hypothetical protein